MKKIFITFLPSLISVIAAFFISIINFNSTSDSILGVVSLVITGIGAITVIICFLISLYKFKNQSQESR